MHSSDNLLDQTDSINSEDETSDTPVSELAMLKQRATLMGIKFSNNISVETLRARIQERLNNESSQPDSEDDQDQPESVPAKAGPSKDDTPAARKKTLREKLLESEMALVRVRITNMDPKKKDLPGEILTVANEFIGTVRKFIPYGEATDNGYHIPMCLYRQLKERTFLSIRTRKGPRGQPIIETSDAREFALEVLPPLTPEELANLAAVQSAASKV